MKNNLLYLALVLAIPPIANGQAVFQKTYGGFTQELISFGHQTSDQGYIFIGHTASFGVGGLDIYIVKTDSIGTLQWSNTYGGTGAEFGAYIEETSDNGFIFTGNTSGFGPEESRFEP